MRVLICVMSAITFFCCDSSIKEEERYKAVPLAKFGLEIRQDPEIFKDEEALFQIFLNNKSYKISAAYVDCEYNQIKDVTIRDGIIGCNKRLHLDNDTVRIYFTPETIDEHTFRSITLLISSDDDLYLGDTTFTYTVKEKEAQHTP